MKCSKYIVVSLITVLVVLLLPVSLTAQTNKGTSKKQKPKTEQVKPKPEKTQTKHPQKTPTEKWKEDNKENMKRLKNGEKVVMSTIKHERPLLHPKDIHKKIQNEDYIVFSDEKGAVYGWDKNNRKYLAGIRHIFAFFGSQFKIYSLRIEYPGEKQKNKPPEIYRILRRFIRKKDVPYANYDTPSLLNLFESLFFSYHINCTDC